MITYDEVMEKLGDLGSRSNEKDVSETWSKGANLWC